MDMVMVVIRNISKFCFTYVATLTIFIIFVQSIYTSLLRTPTDSET